MKLHATILNKKFITNNAVQLFYKRRFNGDANQLKEAQKGRYAMIETNQALKDIEMIICQQNKEYWNRKYAFGP